MTADLKWPVSEKLTVQWGEMDAFGHVNNTVYLRWFETARIAYFLRAGVATRTGQSPIGPILARATIDFRAPVTFPDVVTVEAAVTRVGQTSFTMAYRVLSQRLGAVAAEGEGVVVMFDYARGAKAPVDEPLRARIAALQA